MDRRLDSNPPTATRPPGDAPVPVLLHREGRPGGGQAPAPLRGGPRDPKRRPSLLVVDDEPEVLRSIHDLLRLEYRVLTRGSGAAALEVLLADEEVQVIMSDQRMPGMTGVDLLREAKAIRPEVTR